jgi:hypothetical protein
MSFRATVVGPGAYTFESVDFPGFFLTIGDVGHGEPYLTKVIGVSAIDLRFRFELYASSKDLKMSLLSFDPVMPIGAGPGYDSRVLMTDRIELTRSQVA